MTKSKLDICELRTEKEKMESAKILASSKPWTVLGISYDQIMITLNDTLNEVFVAYYEYEIIGVIIIQTKGAFSGYLKSIAVKKRWRDKHFGKLMMDFVESTIFLTSKNVFLCVSSFNIKAQQFYLMRDYEIVGTLKNYVAEGYDEILMRKTKEVLL